MNSETARDFGLGPGDFTSERESHRPTWRALSRDDPGSMFNPPGKIASFQWARAATTAAAGSVLLACATRVEAQTPTPAGTIAPSLDAHALPQIDITAHGRSLERRLRAFIAAATPRDYADSLTRWNEPICPVVIGPPPGQTTRILAHLLQIAAAAGVSIRQKPCQANLFVVATPYPKRLLTAWGKRDHRLFAGASRKAIDAFLDAPRPVRVWYNTITAPPQPGAVNPEQYSENPTPTEAPGGSAGATASATAAAGVTAAVDAAQDYSLLNFNEVQSFTSVIVVVDTKRAAGFNLDQLSDYIAVLGLSQINLDSDYGGAPTILSIFAPSASRAAKPVPASITGWDRDYLKALYATRQVSREQRLEIADMMARDMIPRAADQ